MDREGVRHGRRPRRLPATGLRHGQVPEPGRARRLRRGVAGRRAVDLSGQPRAVLGPWHHRGRPHHLRGARALPPGAVRPRRQRRRTGSLRVDLRGGGAARASSATSSTAAATATGSTPTSCATTRPAPPTDGPRSTAPASSSTSGPGSRPATTPGGFATRWAGRWTDVNTRDVPDEVSILVIWSPMLLRAARRQPLRACTSTTSATPSGTSIERTEFQGAVEHADGRVEPLRELHPELPVRSAQPPPAGRHPPRGHGRRLGPPDRWSGPPARPASAWVPACTSASTGTGTASGAGPCTSTANICPTAADPATARRVHQLRDCLIQVDDPVGGGHGWGNMQTLAAGPHPAAGPRRRLLVHVGEPGAGNPRAARVRLRPEGPDAVGSHGDHPTHEQEWATR